MEESVPVVPGCNDVVCDEDQLYWIDEIGYPVSKARQGGGKGSAESISVKNSCSWLELTRREAKASFAKRCISMAEKLNWRT